METSIRNKEAMTRAEERKAGVKGMNPVFQVEHKIKFLKGKLGL